MGILQLGSIRKKDDPILKTQTNPIAVKDKMEEIKDGEKGAPSPSMTFYSKETFLTDAPTKTFAEEEDLVSQQKDDAELLFEEEVSGGSNNEEEDWWLDESEEAENSDSEDSGR